MKHICSAQNFMTLFEGDQKKGLKALRKLKFVLKPEESTFYKRVEVLRFEDKSSLKMITTPSEITLKLNGIS